MQVKTADTYVDSLCGLLGGGEAIFQHLYGSAVLVESGSIDAHLSSKSTAFQKTSEVLRHIYSRLFSMSVDYQTCKMYILV